MSISFVGCAGFLVTSMADDKQDNGTGTATVADTSSGPQQALGDGFVMMKGSLQSALEKSKSAAATFRDKSQKVAGPAITRSAKQLTLAGERSVSGFKEIYLGRVKPTLAEKTRSLARALRPDNLARSYRSFLLLYHRLLQDRQIERLCFVRTAGHTPLSIVRVPHQLRRSGHDYRPTPRKVFEWAMEAIPESVERYEFVDFGAGRGRVLLMASQHPFEKITGVEIAEEFYNECLLNIAQFPRSLMKCRDVNCEHISALRLDIPEQETVLYFNNPFDASMTERVIEQIVRAYKRDPRRFYVMFVDMDVDGLMEDAGIFEAVDIPLAKRLKVSAFSPYTISVYRTVHQPGEDEEPII